MPEQLILISILVFFATAAGTISGFGASTIMVPVLALFLPLPLTLLFVGIVHLFGDLWKIILFRKGVRQWKLIFYFAVPGVVASYIGASISASAPEVLMSRILGAFLLGYAAFLFLNPLWKLPEKNITASAGGLLSGFIAGLFGVGGAARRAAPPPL